MLNRIKREMSIDDFANFGGIEKSESVNGCLVDIVSWKNWNKVY